MDQRIRADGRATDRRKHRGRSGYERQHKGVEIPELAQGPDHDHAVVSIHRAKKAAVEDETAEAGEAPAAPEAEEKAEESDED